MRKCNNDIFITPFWGALARDNLEPYANKGTLTTWLRSIKFTTLTFAEQEQLKYIQQKRTVLIHRL